MGKCICVYFDNKVHITNHAFYLFTFFFREIGDFFKVSLRYLIFFTVKPSATARDLFCYVEVWNHIHFHWVLWFHWIIVAFALSIVKLSSVDWSDRSDRLQLYRLSHARITFTSVQKFVEKWINCSLKMSKINIK